MYISLTTLDCDVQREIYSHLDPFSAQSAARACKVMRPLVIEGFRNGQNSRLRAFVETILAQFCPIGREVKRIAYALIRIPPTPVEQQTVQSHDPFARYYSGDASSLTNIDRLLRLFRECCSTLMKGLSYQNLQEVKRSTPSENLPFRFEGLVDAKLSQLAPYVERERKATVLPAGDQRSSEFYKLFNFYLLTASSIPDASRAIQAIEDLPGARDEAYDDLDVALSLMCSVSRIPPRVQALTDFYQTFVDKPSPFVNVGYRLKEDILKEHILTIQEPTDRAVALQAFAWYLKNHTPPTVSFQLRNRFL